MSAKNIAIALGVALLGALALFFVFHRSAPVDEDAKATKQTTEVPAPKENVTRESTQARAGSSGQDVPVQFEDDPQGSLRLEGQVITAEEDPVVGATVSIDSRPPRFATTSEDGSFFFDNLVARNYELVARSSSGAAGPVTARLSEVNDPVILTLRDGGTVSVRVTAAQSGQSIADASVEVRGLAVHSNHTDQEGIAVFRQLPVSRFEVVAKADGYAPMRTDVVVSRSGASADVALALRPGAKVSGTVIDANGKPVTGARVLYQGASDWSVRADPRLDHVLTNEEGDFAFEFLPRGSFRFVASAEGHAQGSSELINLDGETETTGVAIPMEASATLRGRVVDALGAPVSAARVRVAAKSVGIVATGGVRQVYTDDEGHYELGELRRREHEVVAMHETASSEILSADLSKAPHKGELDISLSVDGVISGIVVDSNDEPIAGAQVTLFPDFRKGSSRSASEWRMRGMNTELTDAGGNFRASGLEPNQDFRVRAVPGSSNNPGRAWLSEGVEARTGDGDVRIVLPADGGIRGKVVMKNGDPPEMFTVSVGWMRGTPFSTKDGSFELLELPPKTFTLAIQGPGMDESRVNDVVVEEGKVTDVGTITVKKGRTVSGTVVDAGGSPVANAKVSVGKIIFGDGSSANAEGGGANPLARGTKTVISNEAGRFSVFGAVPGDLSIVADHEELGRSMPVSVQHTSESVEGVRLQLRKTGSLEGIVSKNGSPEDGVAVTATSVSFPTVTYNVASGVDGRYRFDRLIADTYRVKAMYGASPMRGMSFFAEKTEVVADGTTKLDIDFDENGATVRVKLQAEGDLGFSWLSIVGPDIVAKTGRELTAAQGSSIGFEGAGMSIQGAPATARNVPPGSYNLCVIVYPSEVSGMQGTMDYMQREGENLPTQCQPLTVAEGIAEMDVEMNVVIPDFVPEPGEDS